MEVVDEFSRDMNAVMKGDLNGEEEGEASKIEADVEEVKRGLEKYMEWNRRKEEEERDSDPERVTDFYAFEARTYAKNWDDMYGNMGYGRFDEITKIPCMHYTFNPAPHGGTVRDTLQVFSVKVAEISGGLPWPLEVFGMVALRDSMDHNRNIIFESKRGNSQILAEQNPHLELIGPARAVVLCGTMVIEVSLYVRATESDDKELSLLATSLRTSPCPLDSRLIKRSYTSRLSTLDFTLGHIVYSVEATINVRVISRPRPDGFHGRFTVSTHSIGEEAVLLDSGDEEVSLTGDEINLSRRVVSAKTHGKLIVFVGASDGNVTFSDRI